MAEPHVEIGMLGGGTRHPERVDAERWNAVLLAQGGHFLQSWEWCLFQQRVGRRVTFLAMSEDAFAWDLTPTKDKPKTQEAWHDLQLQAAMIEHTLPMGLRYFYIPRGPAMSGAFEVTHGTLFDRFSEHVADLARKRGAAFLRVEPNFPPHWQAHALDHFARLGFRRLTYTIQPAQNLLVNIDEPDGVLLRHMHQKTRYNIRVAQKHGVGIWWADGNEGGAESFLRLNAETAMRQGIRTHAESYYRHMLATIPALPEDPRDILSLGLRHRLYFADYKGEPIATALVVYFGHRAIYLHGGSGDAHRNVMAPYLLHWEIMRDAREMGYVLYDFGGVDDERWPGITRFKKGFAGWIEEFPGMYELPLKKAQYGLYRVARRVRR